MTLTSTKDIFNQDLAIGDTFVIAFLAGKQAVMRAGRVLGFSTRRSSYTPSGQVDLMEVEWYRVDGTKSYWLPTSGTSKIELHQRRLVKVDLDAINSAMID